MSEAQGLLKRMMVSAINSREVENSRVSRLLHDQVGQVLSAVGLQLDVLKLDLRDRIPEITDRVREIQIHLDDAVKQVRALSYDLNPAVVERAGLEAALERLIGRCRSRFPGSLRLFYDMPDRPPLPIANAWYKIAELALENAIQHAEAKSIEVHVHRRRNLMVLEVRDDGRGFDPQDTDAHSPGLGLLLIEHYASQVPIRVLLRSRPGHGTLLRSTYIAEGGEPRPD
ncbi:MAG TPA: histidine kinase [Bryobacteraceae bacterium]|nr:histidine kinase [Bryobacteraceae bacterium]